LNPFSAVYGTAARLRRDWYAKHPASRRRLACRVVSVGNLVVGGSGKTPVVAAVASLLRDRGEKPAILSRGYARRETVDGVTVVSDGHRVLETVERSGDEPLMLARQVTGVPVLVSPDRYAAGTLAHSRFSSTVVVLDDGFQHLQLERDVDLLLVDPADLDEHLLPFGRLREPLDAARTANAVLVHGDLDQASRVGAALGARTVFAVSRQYGAPRLVSPWGEPLPETGGRRAVAVAGIARPGRFFDGLRERGWDVVRELAFRDHRWFSEADLTRIADAARDTRADVIVTTEKDAVRLEGWHTTGPALAFLPMRAIVAPADRFAECVLGQLASTLASSERPER
jgi:tetraacyldisaccharide 4'-kinase